MTRRWSEVVRELDQAYRIEKSTVSQHFIEASRGCLEKLLNRPLGEHALCAFSSRYGRNSGINVDLIANLDRRGYEVAWMTLKGVERWFRFS